MVVTHIQNTHQLVCPSLFISIRILYLSAHKPIEIMLHFSSPSSYSLLVCMCDTNNFSRNYAYFSRNKLWFNSVLCQNPCGLITMHSWKYCNCISRCFSIYGVAWWYILILSHDFQYFKNLKWMIVSPILKYTIVINIK